MNRLKVYVRLMSVLLSTCLFTFLSFFVLAEDTSSGYLYPGYRAYLEEKIQNGYTIDIFSKFDVRLKNRTIMKNKATDILDYGYRTSVRFNPEIVTEETALGEPKEKPFSETLISESRGEYFSSKEIEASEEKATGNIQEYLKPQEQGPIVLETEAKSSGFLEERLAKSTYIEQAGTGRKEAEKLPEEIFTLSHYLIPLESGETISVTALTDKARRYSLAKVPLRQTPDKSGGSSELLEKDKAVIAMFSRWSETNLLSISQELGIPEGNEEWMKQELIIYGPIQDKSRGQPKGSFSQSSGSGAGLSQPTRESNTQEK